jgi:hypothetical protein
MAAGLVTAALALTAHAAAGGAPSGAGAVLLGLLAATVAAITATADAAADIRILLMLLAAGQFVAHTTLTVVGHNHGGDHCGAALGPAMLAAHTLAVVISAVLIAAGDRLCRAVCSAMRVFLRDVPRPVVSAAAARVVGTDQPLQSALLLAASISHRGPPVSLAP